MNEFEDDMFSTTSQRESCNNNFKKNSIFTIDSEIEGLQRESHKSTFTNFPDQEFEQFQKEEDQNLLLMTTFERIYKTSLEDAFFILCNHHMNETISGMHYLYSSKMYAAFQLIKKADSKKYQNNKVHNTFNNFRRESHSKQTVNTNVYIESEFTTGTNSERTSASQRNFSELNSNSQRRMASPGNINKRENFPPSNRIKKYNHTKNKSNVIQRNNQDEFIRNSRKKRKSHVIREVPDFKTQRESTKNQRDSAKSPDSMMRKLREVLEKEEIETITKKVNLKKKPESIKKNFSFGGDLNNPKNQKTIKYPKVINKKNMFQKKSINFNRRQHKTNKNLEEKYNLKKEDKNANTNSAIGKIFFLLSKRFQDTRYRTFFMDQIELLVFKHGIKNQQISNLLKTMDLRFDLKDLLPEESESEDRVKMQSPEDAHRYVQRQMEKKFTKENMDNLEHIMLLFRGDQLFAPLVRHISNRKMMYDRMFFVNLRRFAKLAPFRKIHKTVQERVKLNTRDAFYKILFYRKPNLKLLLLIFTISKIKQRHVLDAFNRIISIYWKHKGIGARDIRMKMKSKGEAGSDLMRNIFNRMKSIEQKEAQEEMGYGQEDMDYEQEDDDAYDSDQVLLENMKGSRKPFQMKLKGSRFGEDNQDGNYYIVILN